MKNLKRLPKKNLEEARRIFGNLKRFLKETHREIELRYLQNLQKNIKIEK